MKRLFFIYAWVLLSVGVVFVGAASLQSWSILGQISKKETPIQTPTPSAQTNLDLAQAGQVKGIQTITQTQDARALLVAEFLERHNSPLEPYDHFGQVFVELADKNNFDFRLLPSIAMQESNLCKRIPPGSYNCLGFGIHERGTLEFESFEANFTRAARELKSNYIDIGLTTPEKIMTKYTPGSNGSWANSVNQWMAEMRYNDRTKGIQLKQDADVLEFAIDE